MGMYVNILTLYIFITFIIRARNLFLLAFIIMSVCNVGIHALLSTMIALIISVVAIRHDMFSRSFFIHEEFDCIAVLWTMN